MKKYILSERVNLYEPNVYIQFYVQITGDFSVKDMEEAVKKAYAANETTMCKIVLEKSGAAYYEKMNGSECRVQAVTEEFREIIREEEKKPFEIEHGEFMRVFIIPSEKEMGVLIMAHHLVGDGKSIIYFIEDVMSALEGKSLDEKPMKLITRESFPEKSELPLGIKLFVRGFNKKWKKKGCTFTWKDYYAVHEAYWKKHDSQVLCRTFCKEEMESIKKNAKKAGVSVNSLIVTAFLKADRQNRVVGIPIDVREKDNYSMSNQVTGISVEHRYTDKNTFAENAGKVHKKIYKSLKKTDKKYFVLRFISEFIPTLIDSALLCTHDCYENKISENLANIMGYKGGKTRDLGITNLTRLDIPAKYGEYKINKIIFIPPVVSYARHIIGASTLENELTITYHFMNQQEIEKEREFFEQGITYLIS